MREQRQQDDIITHGMVKWQAVCGSDVGGGGGGGPPPPPPHIPTLRASSMTAQATWCATSRMRLTQGKVRPSAISAAFMDSVQATAALGETRERKSVVRKRVEKERG